MDTINTTNMRLIEGGLYPSLWLPRFDVGFYHGKRQLFGLESVYSVLDKAPGSPLNHFVVIRELTAKLKRQHRVVELNEPFDVQSFVIELVKRDFLNVIFGNSDNHGRNTALIKRPEGIWLAPIYDFAPMKADPEGIARSTQWGAPFEMGGRFQWQDIALELADVANPEQLMEELQLIARKLVGLKARLVKRGVPDSIIAMPVMRFDHIDRQLEDWRLL